MVKARSSTSPLHRFTTRAVCVVLIAACLASAATVPVSTQRFCDFGVAILKLVKTAVGLGQLSPPGKFAVPCSRNVRRPAHRFSNVLFISPFERWIAVARALAVYTHAVWDSVAPYTDTWQPVLSVSRLTRRPAAERTEVGTKCRVHACLSVMSTAARTDSDHAVVTADQPTSRCHAGSISRCSLPLLSKCRKQL